jgi:hypothetical protein
MSALIPTPLPLRGGFDSPEVAELHRRDDCAAYSACLSLAAHEAWSSWSCMACRSYSRRPRAHVRHYAPELIGQGRRPPVRDVVDGVAIRRDQLVALAIGELRATPSIDWPPIIIMWGGAPEQISSWYRHQAALRLGRAFVPCIPVARARCPLCAPGRTMLFSDPVRRSGFCPECGSWIGAAGSWVGPVTGPSRDKGLDEERREARSRRLRPRGISAALAVIGAAATAASAALDQCDLFEDEGGR